MTRAKTFSRSSVGDEAVRLLRIGTHDSFHSKHSYVRAGPWPAPEVVIEVRPSYSPASRA